MNLETKIVEDGYCDICGYCDDPVYLIPKQLEPYYGCHMELCEYCIDNYEREDDE